MTTIDDANIINIHHVVCAYFGIDEYAPFQNTRNRAVVEKRQIIHYLARKHTDLSLQKIGSYYPTIKFEHGTVIYGSTNIENRMEFEKTLRNQINEIESLLKIEKDFTNEKMKLSNSIIKAKNMDEIDIIINHFMEHRDKLAS